MNWIDLIKKNERKINRAMRKANWNALKNPGLRFYITMNEDGDIWAEEDIAGGNSFSSLVFDGKAIEIESYCYQYFDGNAPIEQHEYVKHLDEMFKHIMKRFM